MLDLKSDLTIFSDGGSRGNPGPAACAYAIFQDGKLIKQDAKYLGITTNNTAEYSAVILALEWVVKNSLGAGIIFNLDSELVVRQLTGVYKIKNKDIVEFVLKIKNLQRINNLEINWVHVPREKNKLADKLVNEKLDESSRL